MIDGRWQRHEEIELASSLTFLTHPSLPCLLPSLDTEAVREEERERVRRRGDPGKAGITYPCLSLSLSLLLDSLAAMTCSQNLFGES